MPALPGLRLRMPLLRNRSLVPVFEPFGTVTATGPLGRDVPDEAWTRARREDRA